MAYSTSNPPALQVQPMAAKRQWLYNSTHTTAEAVANGFFTNGKDLGMALGDTIIITGSTTYTSASAGVIAVSATGVNLSTGQSYSS